MASEKAHIPQDRKGKNPLVIQYVKNIILSVRMMFDILHDRHQNFHNRHHFSLGCLHRDCREWDSVGRQVKWNQQKKQKRIENEKEEELAKVGDHE